jgi:DNA-binding response OmpR family regulator
VSQLKNNVLIIESDPDDLESMVGCLTSKGHRVIGALKGEGLLDLIAALIRPCAILLAMAQDPLPLLERVRAIPAWRATPVIVISSLQLEELPAGADELLHKPLNFDELLAAVGRYCRSVPVRGGGLLSG